MDAQRLRAFAPTLPQLVRIVREIWLDAAAKSSEEIPPGHGCLRGGELLAVVDEAFRELVLPGSPTWAWTRRTR